jgi:hypothetical protein
MSICKSPYDLIIFYYQIIQIKKFACINFMQLYLVEKFSEYLTIFVNLILSEKLQLIIISFLLSTEIFRLYIISFSFDIF